MSQREPVWPARARTLLGLLLILTLLVGAAAGIARTVGEMLITLSTLEIGPYRGVMAARNLATEIEVLDGVDSVDVESVAGDKFVPSLGLVVVRTGTAWDREVVERLAAELEGTIGEFRPQRPIHVGIATSEAFVAVTTDRDENRMRIASAARALDAGAGQVHVAPRRFDTAKWSPAHGASLVRAVPAPGESVDELEVALVAVLGPEVQISDHAWWPSATG